MIHRIEDSNKNLCMKYFFSRSKTCYSVGLTQKIHVWMLRAEIIWFCNSKSISSKEGSQWIVWMFEITSFTHFHLTVRRTLKISNHAVREVFTTYIHHNTHFNYYEFSRRWNDPNEHPTTSWTELPALFAHMVHSFFHFIRTMWRNVTIYLN